MEAQTEKLKKLLALTNSDNDHEALLAVRQANRILKDANQTWSDVIVGNSREPSAEHKQLYQQYAALADKYNSLVQMFARQQAMAALSVPQRRTPPRRTRRF